MSDPLAPRWAALRTEGRTALIPYLTAGYPTPDASARAITMACEVGADFLEVGVPFSDPVADGPVIQKASFDALAAGMTVRGALDLVRATRPAVPVVVFSYLNPLLAYGLPRFLDDAAAAGVGGILVTDLPIGSDPSLEEQLQASSLAWIRLVAPTTDGTRLARAAGGAQGFLYVIARLGVTGARTRVGAAVSQTVARLRRTTSCPVAVGFGIADGTQARAVAAFADGVVVGSALVERLANGLEAGRTLLAELRQALDERL